MKMLSTSNLIVVTKINEAAARKVTVDAIVDISIRLDSLRMHSRVRLLRWRRLDFKGRTNLTARIVRQNKLETIENVKLNAM